jgi:transposase, IS30 family
MKTYRQLSQQERYMITALLRSRRLSHAHIARELGRSASTISRELSRNRTHSDDAYRADVAHSYATARRRRERRGFRHSAEEWAEVVRLLKQEWSPQQISGRLKLLGSFHISHETIYQYILADRKHGGTLFKYLRCSSKLRRKRHGSHDSRGILPGKRHISERPASAESRRWFGHWEGDTVMGSDLRHGILSLVERKSGVAIIKKLSSRTVSRVNAAALSALDAHRGRFKTITFDNGTEFHGYKTLEQHYPKLKCYFATPYHSWERGSNENLNGLIRQYLPKRTSMKSLTQDRCNFIAMRLNTRPRKRHGYRTPLEVYNGRS